MLESFQKIAIRYSQIWLIFLLCFHFTTKVISQVYDFTSPLTIEKTLTFPGEYAVIVAAPSEILWNTLAFDPSAQNSPNSRIFYAMRFSQTAPTLGTVTIPRLYLANYTDISLHFLTLTSSGSTATTPVVVSLSKYVYDFPTIGDSFEERGNSFADLQYGLDNYKTYIYSFYVEHDLTKDIYCTLTVRGGGMVRVIYSNDNFQGQYEFYNNPRTVYPFDNTANLDVKVYQFYFRAQQLNIVTIVGYRLRVANIILTPSTCKWVDTGASASPTFTYYYTSNSAPTIAAPSEILQVDRTKPLITCPAHSLKCFSSTLSLRCDINYPRFHETCVQGCPTNLGYTRLNENNDCQFETIPYRLFFFVHPPFNDPQLDTTFYSDFPATKVLLLFSYNNDHHSMAYSGQFVKPPGNSISMPESVPHIIYTTGPGNLSFSLTMIPLGTVQAFVYGFEVDETISMMIEQTTSTGYPATDQLRITYEKYILVKAGETAYFSSSRYCRVTSYIECNSTCQVSIFANGTITGIKNDNAFLLQIDMGVTPWNYTLYRTFSGVIKLAFEVLNGGVFRIAVHGENSKVFGHKFNSYQDYTTINVLNGANTLPNPALHCFNGYNNICFSCEPNYFLEGQNCVSTSTSGKNYPYERLSVPSCTGSLVPYDSNTCYPKCSEPGKFYIDNVGCTGQCLPGCLVCSNATTCLECHPNTTLDENQICVGSSYVNIIGSSAISSCSDLFLSASIDPQEEQRSVVPIPFTWSVISDSASDPDEINLNQYLLTQTTKDIRIPYTYLKPNVVYTFRVSYLNEIGMNISTSFNTATISDLVPTVIIDGDIVQNIKRFKNNLIKVNAFYSSCLQVNNSLDVAWSSVGGTPLPTLDSFVHPSMPLWLNFTACSLSYNSTYNLSVKVNVNGFPTFYALLNPIIQVDPEIFYAQIEFGNRAHPFNKPLELKGVIVYEGTCPDTDSSTVTYTWTCKKATTLNSPFRSFAGPAGLFGVARSTPDFVLPVTYFSKNQMLEITLTVTKNGISVSTTTVITIQGATTMVIELSCTTEDDTHCIKIGTNDGYTFEANIAGTTYNPSTKYTWTIDPPMGIATYQNLMRIVSDIDTDLDDIKVSVTVTNATHNGGVFLEIPVNKPPRDGSLIVSPTLGGSLSTYFYLHTSDWTDDGDYPLTYQFFFSSDVSFDRNWKLLTDVQKLSYTYTYLSAKVPSQTIYIQVKVTDALGLSTYSTTSVEIGVSETKIEEATEKLQGLLDLVSSSTNPYENARMALLVNMEIANWEQKATENSNENCPYCSGHGSCPEDTSSTNPTCKCDSGWTLPDCSVKQAVFADLVALKDQAVNIAQDSFEKTNTPEMKNMLLQTLQTASESALFNNNQTITSIQRILEETLSGSLLTEEQSQTASTIVNNLLQYAATDDCNCTTDFCANMQDKTEDYLNQISTGPLDKKLPNEKPIVLENDLFDVLTVKTTPCEIANLNLSLGADAPLVSIVPTDLTNLDCDQEIILQLYAFKDRRQMFSCTGSPIVNDYKNVLMTALSDALGNLLSAFQIKVTLPNVIPCYRECTPDKGNCICPLLDVKAQMTKIFQQSDLGTLKNIAALRDWEWSKSPMFWVNVGMFAGFIFSIILVKTKLKDYCKYREYQKSSNRAFWNMFLTAFSVIRKILSNQ